MKLGVLFLGIPWPCILYQMSVCGAENQVLGCICRGFVKASKTNVFPRINVQLYSKAGSPATCPDNALAGAAAPDGLNQLCHVQSPYPDPSHRHQVPGAVGPVGLYHRLPHPPRLVLGFSKGRPDVSIPTEKTGTFLVMLQQTIILSMLSPLKWMRRWA